MDDIYPNRNQHLIIDSVKSFYNKKKFANIFIQGEPGCGKTTITMFLAKELNGCICKTFKPFEPGDTLIKLVDKVNPTFEKPLIILFDEINILIRKIHDLKIERHKDIPISVYDKTSFNTFLEDMKQNLNIILVMTSNESRDQIDMLDKSYLREGRVNMYFSL